VHGGFKIMAGGYKINLLIESFPIENSPAIYGWEKSSLYFASPVRDERTFLPSLTGLVYFRRIIPSHKWLGYFQRQFARRDFPKRRGFFFQGEANEYGRHTLKLC